MPILFMGLVALLIFLAMGFMLFYAAYAEHHTPHESEPEEKAETKLPATAPR